MTARSEALHRLDTRPVPSTTSEVRAFLVVRDEITRLPHVLAHHRRLGIERFFIVDNGSIDGTREFAAAQPDVHLFTTSASYQAAHLGIDWLTTLLGRFGRDRWCLVIDADEQLVYPDCERKPVADLCATIDGRGLNCLATTFIDLYGEGAIAASRADPQVPLLDVCPYFDKAGYVSLPIGDDVLPRRFGGARARLFWPERSPERAHADMCLAAAQSFDADDYLSRHRDVADAVAAGVVASAWDHYRAYGWREAREVVVHRADGWPEAAYLAAQADVRDAVAQGTFASGLEHFVRFGQFEGRLLDDWPPCLTQVPLLRWDSSLRLLPGRHGLRGARWPGPGLVGGALLHFRLMADALDRARSASTGRRGPSPVSAWSDENRRYVARLAAAPRLAAFGELSVRYNEVDDLVALGLVSPGSSL